MTNTPHDNHPVQRFQQTLEHSSGKRLRLRINDNRSTMLSVRWEPDYTRVSAHHIFLEAPRNVMDALACYLKGDNRSLGPAIKRFIEEKVKTLDYSKKIDQQQLHFQGAVYNLQQIYDAINEQYFQDRLRLLITWFEQQKNPKRAKITLGLYQDTLRLVKINRLLDSRSVPASVVHFIVYHEMLHAACPPYVDEGGINHIHSREFKRRERLFDQYNEASRWIYENRSALFDVG